jgi:hypothetical protein
VTTKEYRPLTAEEIQTLTDQGCCCNDWANVQVAEGFLVDRVRGATFSGTILLGDNSGETGLCRTLKPNGIYNAHLDNCVVGDCVRIANIGSHIANYDIGDGANIENVGRMDVQEGATFGAGVEIETLNEGGGREVPLFPRLDSQFAYLLCVHRHREELIKKLLGMAEAETAAQTSDRGTVGPLTIIRNVGEIEDVNIGENVMIEGAALLSNGTILGSSDTTTLIGDAVQAEDFIIGEGSKVTGGAIVCSSFVGQGCQIGKQFSSEGSLFFANCEGFHGEACSVFAGPYTVTHHKSTLLIAGLFSFYNAGSGTNQSNHLYKLGPLHEGKLERGCKTGSFSYMMWPCRVGPFSVVLGKHKGTFDTGDFPFSYIDAASDGRAVITPGFNLTTVGTVRDGAKWPARDRRKGSVKRDRISFDVFSPLTVGRMITGMQRMKALQDATPREVEWVSLGGAAAKRLILRTGQKTYKSATHMYLLSKVVERMERGLEHGTAATDVLPASPDAVYSEQWVDIGGQMMPIDRLNTLCTGIESGQIADIDALSEALDDIHAAYVEDEWAWVRKAYAQVFGSEIDDASKEDLVKVADAMFAARKKFLNLVLNDASKEFSEQVMTGFGHDGESEDHVNDDFTAVRGDFDTNKFVVQMNAEIAELGERVEKIKQALV